MYLKPSGIAKPSIHGTRKSRHHQACRSAIPILSVTGCLTCDSSYITSLLFAPFTGGCHTASLRILNVGAICIVCLLAYQILRNLCSPNLPGKNTEDHPIVILNAHSALNISLFPPLFFFSAFYYTDVISTLLVLLCYSTFTKKAQSTWSTWDGVMFLLVGLLALLFRQTNIFWIAVFPSGLAVINALKKVGPTPSMPRKSSILDMLQQSWRHGTIYDFSAQEGGFQGKTFSLSACASEC
jgi:alpha-1,2-glucosyltransferase